MQKPKRAKKLRKLPKMSEYLLICEDGGERIDSFIAKNTELSRSRAASLIEEGRVLLNDRVAVKKDKLKVGDKVTVEVSIYDPTKGRITWRTK